MQTVLIEGVAHNLESLETLVWQRLVTACSNYKDVLHNPVVANVNEHGVNLRTLVVRKVWQDKKQLAFNTDIRSGKWQEIQQQNKISWLFYDDVQKVQIRLGGTATLHKNDAAADAAWAASSPSSRKIYLCNPGPSSISVTATSGLPAALEGNIPTLQESEAGRKNFGTIITTINWMEWLWLNSAGHRRAGFTYNEAGNFSADWLIP